MLSLIVAVASNGAIGLNNKLLWYLPEDLKRFRSLTNGKTLIMGRKTFESLPGVLPKRKHIVISNNALYSVDHPQVSICHQADSLLAQYARAGEEAFIIGGGSLYGKALPLCNKLYITEVKHDFEADTFFSKLDPSIWNLTEESPIFKDSISRLSYQYKTYVK